MSGAPGRWVLCNASPDIRQQIEAFPELHPQAARHSPLSAIVLTNGDLDHVLGLFTLRESYPLVIYSTDAVRNGLEGHNLLMRTLRRFEGQLTWRPLVLDREVALTDAGNQSTGLWVTARPIKGKVPVHLEGVVQGSAQDNVGVWIRDGDGKTIAYVTAAAELANVAAHCHGLHALLLDGTFWSSDELSRGGLSKSRAEDMAHLPIGDRGGSLEWTTKLGARRRIYTHLNNTNPILVDDSPQCRAVRDAGWEVAYDGMEID